MPEEASALIEGLLGQFQPRLRADPLGAAAWFLDTRCIVWQLEQKLRELPDPHPYAKQIEDLVRIARIWVLAFRTLIATARQHLRFELTDSVIPPYALRDWKPCVTTKIANPSTIHLHLATVGWWELILPTAPRILSLIKSLIELDVHVCSVTGLPALSIISTIENTPYYWVGEHHTHSGGAGMLIQRKLREVARQLPSEEEAGCRLVSIQIESMLIQAVYNPHVGKLSLAESD